MRAYRLYHIERLFVNLFRYIVTGKTAAVSDSRLLIDHLILFYTAFFLSAVDGCEDSCTAADKPVSYTHLDVYKRQVLYAGLFCNHP